MKSLTFRLRIALLSALISGVVLVAFGATAYYLIGQQKLQSLDTEIRSLGARHPGWFANRGGYERLNSSLEFIFGEERQDQIILLVQNAEGRLLYRSPGWPDELAPDSLEISLSDDPKAVAALASDGRDAVPVGPGGGRGPGGAGRGPGFGRGGPPQATFTKVPRFETVRAGETSWRLGMLGTPETTLVVGLNLAPLQAEMRRVRTLFLLALPAALVLIGVGGWLVASRALHPLRTIAQTAERVTAQGLDQRIPPWSEDPEIGRLIDILNRMMDRLETSFRQAIRFSADASHELKTPLAVMQGELENALQAARPGSREQQVLANLLEETQRLKTITRSLLLLAQADAGQLPLALERVNLSTALGELTEDLEALAAEARVRFEVKVEPETWVKADGPLLRQAILNLLQNALRYNEPDGWIAVALGKRDGQVQLEIANGGPGIPEADQPRLFDRFFRADAARSRHVDGLGLGLSLAREIVRAHGGALVLQASQPGRTCFMLTLPESVTS